MLVNHRIILVSVGSYVFKHYFVALGVWRATILACVFFWQVAGRVFKTLGGVKKSYIHLLGELTKPLVAGIYFFIGYFTVFTLKFCRHGQYRLNYYFSARRTFFYFINKLSVILTKGLLVAIGNSVFKPQGYHKIPWLFCFERLCEKHLLVGFGENYCRFIYVVVET